MFLKKIVMIGFCLVLFPVCIALAVETASPSPARVLSWENCLELGFTNSQDLQMAAKNVQVAQENVKQAKAALGVTVDYSIVRANDHTNTDSIEYNSGTLSLNLPFLNYFKLSNSLKVAELELAKAREEERQARMELTFEIRKALYSLWLKERELAVAQASYDNLGQHYQTIKKMYGVGNKAGYELLEAEVAWKGQKAEVISALSDLSLAKLALATLTGIDKDQDIQLVYDPSLQQLPEKIQLTLQTLLDKAEKQRPDLVQAKQNMEIAQFNLRIAKSNNLPALSLAWTQTDLNDESQLALSINGTLFDNKATAAKVKAAERMVEIARLNQLKTSDKARQTVQKIFETIRVDLENAFVFKANIDLAAEDLRLTEIRYTAGMSTIMDVKDRQLALDKARNDYYRKSASYLTDLAELDLEISN